MLTHMDIIPPLEVAAALLANPHVPPSRAFPSYIQPGGRHLLRFPSNKDNCCADVSPYVCSIHAATQPAILFFS